MEKLIYKQIHLNYFSIQKSNIFIHFFYLFILTNNQFIYIFINLFRFSLYLTNLFNGDKALGDNMNLFINENWRDILKELKPSIQDTISQILQNIINRIFAKIPYDDIFLD